MTEGYHKLSHGDRALPLLNRADSVQDISAGSSGAADPAQTEGAASAAPEADSVKAVPAAGNAPAVQKSDSTKQ